MRPSAFAVPRNGKKAAGHKARKQNWGGHRRLPPVAPLLAFLFQFLERMVLEKRCRGAIR